MENTDIKAYRCVDCPKHGKTTIVEMTINDKYHNIICCQCYFEKISEGLKSYSSEDIIWGAAFELSGNQK